MSINLSAEIEHLIFTWSHGEVCNQEAVVKARDVLVHTIEIALAEAELRNMKQDLVSISM